MGSTLNAYKKSSLSKLMWVKIITETVQLRVHTVVVGVTIMNSWFNHMPN